MSTSVLIAGFIVVFLATAIQGAVGFGANLLAMPIMVQLDPDLVPGPTLVATALLNVFVVWAEREHIQFRPVGEALAGRLVGTGVAVVALGYLSQRGIGFAVVFMVLVAVGLSVAGVSAERTPRNMVTAGVASGFGATTAGIGGPPVAIMFSGARGPEIRASLAFYFLAGLVVTLGALSLAGRFGATEATSALALVPASVLGFAASRPLSRVIDRGYARPAILIISTVAALSLLYRLLA